MRKIALLIFLLSSVALQTFAQDLDSMEGDLQALEALYNATDGENWHDNTGWTASSMSLNNKIVGVTTEIIGGERRVTRIDLQKVRIENGETLGNNLTGTIESVPWGNLKKVTYLNLKQNKLTGRIPPSLGYMESLEWLSLAGQRCDIRIGSNMEPNYRGCSGGKGDEVTNEFRGPIPEAFGNLTNLKILEIRKQYLTGTLPTSLGKLKKLVGIFIDQIRVLDGHSISTALTGPIPDSFGDLTKLQHIELSNGRENDIPGFTGQIPVSMQENLNTSEESYISISGNSFEGPVPRFLNMTNLRRVTFASNKFSGEFPIEYFNQGNNANLWMFSVDANNLTGEIPHGMVPPTFPTSRSNYNAISVFRIGGNDFSGTLPEWVQELPVVQWSLSGNSFNGAFPKTMAEGSRVRLMRLGGNNFSGTLPDVNFNSDDFADLTLSDNDFEGPIPESWSSLDTGKFWRFEAENMELEGELPDWMASIPTLRRIYLRGNKFTFRDILPKYDAILQNVIEAGGAEDRFRITNQKPFGNPEVVTIKPGSSFSFDYSHRIHESDKIQWTKDGNPIDGGNSAVLKIDSASEIDSGIYKVEISNSRLPEMGTLVSEPIELRIGEDGGNGKGPQKSTPAKGDDKVSKKPTFKWNKVEEAETYELEVMDAETQELLINEIVADTSYTPGKEFQTNHKYQWRVRTVTTNGEIAEWSDIWEFTTADEEVAFEVEVEQNYPNPFNPSTNIRFNLAEQQEVSLKVYDMTGRLVATLINSEVLGNGMHSARFDANNLASGIYFYRLITPGEIVTRKMTLMK